LQHLPEGTEKTIKSYQYIQPLGQESNLGSPKYKEFYKPDYNMQPLSKV
jgi:hypothetical protein